MPRLVTKPQTELTTEDTGLLQDLLRVSIEKDRDYFAGLGILRNMLRGDHWAHKKQRVAERLRVTINLVHAHIRTLLPTLFFKNPSVRALPTTPDREDKAQKWSSVLNNTNRKVGFKKETKECIHG